MTVEYSDALFKVLHMYKEQTFHSKVRVSELMIEHARYDIEERATLDLAYNLAKAIVEKGKFVTYRDTIAERLEGDRHFEPVRVYAHDTVVLSSKELRQLLITFGEELLREKLEGNK